MINDTKSLSIIIPARNEIFLDLTIKSVLESITGNTEIIVILDGYWPAIPIQDNPLVHIIHFTEAIGQRAAVNVGASISRAQYIMKLDAHCKMDHGFDTKLMSECDYDWTVVPRLYNLHAFDRVCGKCGYREYQGPTLLECPKCGIKEKLNNEIVWMQREKRMSDFMCFDSTLHFQYWKKFEKRPESMFDIAPVMGNLGACWMMNRKRYFDLGGLDERHGSWGQMGTEISCKTWLSGGKQMVNKKTWYSHMFRTQGGDFGFPFPLSAAQVQTARTHSHKLWILGMWEKPHKSLFWLIDKFGPVPGWENYKWAT